MNIWTRRFLYAIGTVSAVFLLYAMVYQWCMRTFEGEPVTYIQALQVVVEAITTAGFGGHAPWQSGVLNVMVLAMNLTGVLFVFLAVPVFLVPLFREVIRSHPPSSTDITGHIIICTHTARGDAFISELIARNQGYVIIEPDRDVARRLYDDGYQVMVGDPESVDVLKNANIADAMAVVADAEDDVNASIALSVREIDSDIRVVTLVEDPALVTYHRLAGADDVLSPRQLVGESLARQVPTVMRASIAEGVPLGGEIKLVELKVEPDGELIGKTIGDLLNRGEYATDLIGAWKDGEFTSPLPDNFVLDSGVRLLVAGPASRIKALQEEASATLAYAPPRSVVIAGYGRAGEAAASVLAETSASVTVLDREPSRPVDVVGDVRDPDVLVEAGVKDATAAIITVDDDTTAILATLVMRDLNPGLYIIVRANAESDERKLYRAGANYVQSLATVSGRMLASTILQDEEVLSFEQQIEIVKLPAGRLAGMTLADADVRTETGVVVLAIYRDGETHLDMDPNTFEIAKEDALIIAGMTENIRHFETRYLG
ncbi:potassium transporter [Longibacter salinarum]|uniref:Potassium transporter n=1 Tax=Longibacter salinarum TaxID=1850348 RepID=A0A2A8CVU4_9BACT|nr:NAD-binding protein [Longibacter salinarum]PEN12717.1 potassium transporter [Longibacter salinarum]